MDEFKDFEKYVKGVDPYGMQSGIVLIDPPEEWYGFPSLMHSRLLVLGKSGLQF
jgi:jmjN domain